MPATATRTVETLSAASRAGVASAESPNRRHRLIVNRRYQFRAGMLVGLVALALLVLLDFSLYLASRPSGPATAAATAGWPSLAGSPIQSQVVLTIVGSVVFLVGVVLVGILESHRTAGAAYRIVRGLERLRAGDRDVLVVLRKDDHLKEVALAVNDLSAALRDREARDLEALERIVALAEAHPTGGAVDGIVSDLRDLTTARRRSLD